MLMLAGGLFGLALLPMLILTAPFLLWLLVPLAVLSGGIYLANGFKKRQPRLARAHR